LNFMVDISISKKGQDNEFNVLLEQIKFLDYISSVVVLAKIAKHAYWDKIKLIASNKIIEISKICNDDRCFDIIYDLAKDINHYKSKFNLFRALMENAGMTDIVSFLDCLSDFCEYDAFEKIGQPEIQSILNQYSLNEMKHDVIVTQLTKIVDSILSTICSRNGINTPRKTIFDMFGNEYGLYIHELNIPIKTINYKPIYYYRGEFMSIPFYIKDYPKKDELLPYHSKISQSVAYKYHLISIRCERFMQSGYWSDRGVDEFNKYFKYSIDLIKNLCNTVIATNILYNLSKKTDIDIKLSGSCGSEYKLEISNKPIRDMAREELARRGNPPYDISAYAEFITNRSK